MSRKEKKAEKQRKKELKAGTKLLDPEEGLMEGHEMERPLTPVVGRGNGGYGVVVGGGDRYEPYQWYGAQDEGCGTGALA